ncbi:hypothetical protein VZC37_23690 [Gordonia sp. LSe1-13]|uniref:Translation initiation factor IF-2 n=1 Tax=Gordonia sesuvii TaxID=3116777 RepID=A0ABU7MJR6_9ACTN|nr:hypothetical protein [Gordonia sp. LSe1-13]
MPQQQQRPVRPRPPEATGSVPRGVPPQPVAAGATGAPGGYRLGRRSTNAEPPADQGARSISRHRLPDPEEAATAPPPPAPAQPAPAQPAPVLPPPPTVPAGQGSGAHGGGAQGAPGAGASGEEVSGSAPRPDAEIAAALRDVAAALEQLAAAVRRSGGRTPGP